MVPKKHAPFVAGRVFRRKGQVVGGVVNQDQHDGKKMPRAIYRQRLLLRWKSHIDKRRKHLNWHGMLFMAEEVLVAAQKLRVPVEYFKLWVPLSVLAAR